MMTYDPAIQRARDVYVETVTNSVLAFLHKQGVVLTNRGQDNLSDIIRFETTP